MAETWKGHALLNFLCVKYQNTQSLCSVHITLQRCKSNSSFTPEFRQQIYFSYSLINILKVFADTERGDSLKWPNNLLRRRQYFSCVAKFSLLAAYCCSLSLAKGVYLIRVAHDLRNRGTIWTQGMLIKVTHVMATGRYCASL